MTSYLIRTHERDGKTTYENFDDEESFGFAFAEYCGCGYRGIECGRVADVYPPNEITEED